MHHRVMAVGSAGIAGICFIAGLEQIRYTAEPVVPLWSSRTHHCRTEQIPRARAVQVL
jgi:hypothetical protein